ncbi:energy transducer TonB [Carboxylicivirga sp. N1Y90]|uniref:energy transducer TonB n=1 Tax=Carboxylicivirga fragile TaxID=3417571 RepID=UPI003D346DFC|nr:TonB family protein [Marinilabiliaceae bacterium N1Y90]
MDNTLSGVYGTVFISFYIDVDGSVITIKILRGVSSEIDAEAIRVIKAMPLWKPGKQLCKTIIVSYTIPVRFSLN